MKQNIITSSTSYIITSHTMYDVQSVK